MTPVDYDDENGCGSGNAEDFEDDEEEEDRPVFLHSGKFEIPNRDHLAARIAEARQIILERNSGSIRCKSNIVIETKSSDSAHLRKPSPLTITMRELQQSPPH